MTIGALLEWWKDIAPDQAILLVYGGRAADFNAIAHTNKIFIDDPRLRTVDNQRERQSYHGIWQQVARWLKSSNTNFEFVYFAEYDHLPLTRDLNSKQLQLLQTENADVLAFRLQRIDGTSHPHYLYHVRDPEFHAFFDRLSVRADKRVILSMFGSGSFWKREAFQAVAATEEPFPIYTELFLPTVAHHLGFRLRDYGKQNLFVHNLGDYGNGINVAKQQGAWTIHPVKEVRTRHPLK